MTQTNMFQIMKKIEKKLMATRWGGMYLTKTSNADIFCNFCVIRSSKKNGMKIEIKFALIMILLGYEYEPAVIDRSQNFQSPLF